MSSVDQFCPLLQCLYQGLPAARLDGGDSSWRPQYLVQYCRSQGDNTQLSSIGALLCMQVVLARWCRQDDIVVGVPYNGRDMPELQHLVGNFINMLPLRTRLPANNATLAAVLQDVQQNLTAALSHAELPFGKLVEGLGVPRSATRTPVFQAIVAMNERMNKPSTSGLILRPAEPEVHASI